MYSGKVDVNFTLTVVYCTVQYHLLCCVEEHDYLKLSCPVCDSLCGVDEPDLLLLSSHVSDSQTSMNRYSPHTFQLKR